MLQYYDDAKKYLKIAQNFSVQYFGNCIPKNAIYGKVSKVYFLYVDDYKQFFTKQTIFKIWTLDKRSKSGRFQESLIKKHSMIYNHIMAMIEFHELENTKCEYQLKLKHVEKPQRRTTGEFIFSASPRQLLDSRAAEYGKGITDYSVTEKTYIPYHTPFQYRQR